MLRMLGPLLSCLQPPNQVTTEPATDAANDRVMRQHNTIHCAHTWAAEYALPHPFSASLPSLKASRSMARLHDPLACRVFILS